MKVRLASHFDIPDRIYKVKKILEKNLIQNVPESQRATNGFLKYNAPLEFIEKRIFEDNLILALDGFYDVAGYFMMLNPDTAASDPFFSELMENSKSMRYQDKPVQDYKFNILGQICIDHEYRNNSSARQLHDFNTAISKERGLRLGLTEINEQNQVSLNVHLARPDFFEIGSYQSRSGGIWRVVVKDYQLGGKDEI